MSQSQNLLPPRSWFLEQQQTEYWPAFFDWRARFCGDLVIVAFDLIARKS